ncbi:hypothetical protein ACFU96_21815 [Streptomyces sp. NPDC057620]|uniref:hypothetical protein n=1 Tax=Streptomyces sp. NPDC057620 TaxID=3346185 RepID=UPI0036A83086
MAFPETALPIRVELQLGAVWTDITGDVRSEQQIRIQRGRSDDGGQVDTTRCSLTLDNNDGRYTPKNPTGFYYGQIGRNTPLRVSVLTGTPYLDLPGGNLDYAETPDTAAIDIVGDLDVRVDMSLSNWLPPAGSGTTGTVEWIGKHSLGQRSWFLGARNGRVYFEWSADGTNTLSALSTIPPVIPGAGGRLSVRVALDVNNGSGGWTVRFYTTDVLDGLWTQLGDPVSGVGVTSIFNSTTPLRVGNATTFTLGLPVGRFHAAEVRNGLWGTVVAQPRFNQQTVGAPSFVDSAGLTWTMSGGSVITNRQTRFVGEVSSWAPRWETKHDVVCQVEASGVMRRMTAGSTPVRSPMYREFTNPARTNIVGYWPMEDEAAATTFASALPGQIPMRVPAGVTLATYSDWVASTALPSYTFGVSKVRMTPYTPTNYVFTRFFAAVPAGGVSFTDRLFSFTTTGTARTWSLFVSTSGGFDLRAYDEDGTNILTTGFFAFAVNGKRSHIGVELTQVGADISYRLIAFDLAASTLATLVSGAITGTVAGYTAGAATELRFGQDGGLNGTAIGHLVVASDNQGFANTTGAMLGWVGEVTTARLPRLATEEGITAYAASISDQQMGAQGLSTIMELMRDAEAADEGVLTEERSFLGLRFRDHVSLYNQPVAVTLDYTGVSGLVTPLEPSDDDTQPQNDVTVQRTSGSSARRDLTEGRMSTQAPPAGVGHYPTSVTRNLFEDAQNGEHAGWLLRLGTVDETRYPVVRVMLSKAPAMIEAVAALDIGDRFAISNPPAGWLAPDTIDQMVQGYTEVLDQFTWNIDFNASPARPWDVAWVGDGTTATAAREFDWADSAGSQLAEDLTTTETDVDLWTSTGPRWTPNVRDTPFELRVGGENMTVVAPGGLVNANPFFDDDASGWSGQSATFARSLNYVCPHPRARASVRVVPDGVAASGGVAGTQSAVGTITPGATYTLSGWFFSANGWANLQPCVDWATSAGTYISTGLGAGSAVASSVWTYLEQDLVAPATASRATVRGRHGGTPAASDIWYGWAIRITRKSSSWLYDTFSRTSAAGWGISDAGPTWASVGGGVAGDYTVSGTYASHVLSTVNDTRRTGIAAPSADFDIYCDVTTSATATGDSLYGAVTARMLDASNMYMARAEFTTGNAILITVRKLVAGVQTQLGSTFTLPFTHAAGTFIRVRFQGIGTALRAKAWRVTDPEPDVWRVDTTDASFTAAQQLGTRSVRVTGNTNAAAVEVRYDNYELVNPQTYTVMRSQNRVVKAHLAGADVRLAFPAYTAL